MTATTLPVAAAASPARRRARPGRSTATRVALGLVVPILFLVFWHIGRQIELELPFGIRMG